MYDEAIREGFWDGEMGGWSCVGAARWWVDKVPVEAPFPNPIGGGWVYEPADSGRFNTFEW